MRQTRIEVHDASGAGPSSGNDSTELFSGRRVLTMNDIDKWLQKDISPWLQANAARGIYERGPDLEEIELLGFGDGVNQDGLSEITEDRQEDAQGKS